MRLIQIVRDALECRDDNGVWPTYAPLFDYATFRLDPEDIATLGSGGVLVMQLGGGSIPTLTIERQPRDARIHQEPQFGVGRDDLGDEE